MKLFILSADDSKQMEEISKELSENKFKVVESDENYILMKKRRYGNIIIQIVCLALALLFSAVFIFINLAYFTYSYLWASPNVLITIEKVAENGEKLEFDSMDEVLRKANATL
jgi:hypothetical protein